MLEGVETRAAACALATRRTDWIAEIGDADRLERWGRTFVRWYYERLERERPDPRTSLDRDLPVIKAPECSPALDRRLWVPHEMGHVLMDTWLAFVQNYPWPEGGPLQRLAQKNQLKEEATAIHFTLAWLLPPAVFREIDDLRWIARRSRLPLELVNLRARYVEPRFELTEPPFWCAGRVHDLYFTEAPSSALCVVLRDGRLPGFVIPVSRSTRAFREFQVKADLVALTPPEFGRRYRGYRIAPAEPLDPAAWDAPIPLRIEDLRLWSLETRLSRVRPQAPYYGLKAVTGNGSAGLEAEHLPLGM